MSAGRRGMLLSAAFFALTLALCSSARAQPPQFKQFPPPDPQNGKHEIWEPSLSPDQIRDLLKRFGQGDKNANSSLEKAIRDKVLEKNPNAGKNQEQLDAAIKRLMADKDFMDWAMDQAQKHKNQNPGERFEITPEMLQKLKNRQPGGPKDDPFKLPKIDERPVPPVDPNPPKINPPVPPNGNPPPQEQPKPKFDPDNPLGAPKDSPEKLAKQKAAETATALWEKNVGPIDESPAVRRAILDLISDPEAMEALTDSKGNSIFDSFRDGGADGDGLNNLFGDNGKGWEWPKFDFKLDWGNNNNGRNIDIPERAPRSRLDPPPPNRRGDSSMGGMGSFDFGGVRVPWLFAFLFLAAVLAAVVWWKWAVLFPPNPQDTTNGVGPWPVDPAAINTREDIVKAFEYLSVLLCGPGAKTWNHATIADELTTLAAANGETAMKLARLYELARYAPLDEPLTRAEIIEARRLACDLAGVDEA